MLRTLLIAWVLLPLLIGCGVKLEEGKALKVMDNIFKARKYQNIDQELGYYHAKGFEIIPFNEHEDTLRSVMSQVGSYKSRTHVGTRTQNRNQLGKGLVKYKIITYEVAYSRMTLTENYFFLAATEKPQLVYATFQM